jgi:hypothetical protein
MEVTNHTENGLQAPYRMKGILCYSAGLSEAPLPREGSMSTKKEALLSESLLFVNSTCFRRLALEQADERLLACVRLSEHRCSSLLQDLEAGQLTALGSDIDIDDTAVGGFKVDSVDIQEVLSEIDTTHFRAVLRAHVSELLKSLLSEECIFVRI